jgi:hypothetical protein
MTTRRWMIAVVIVGLLLTSWLRGRALVPATISEQTLVGYNSIPPQPRGNCFSVSPTPLRIEWWIGLRDGGGGGLRGGRWRVANMHAENFEGIVKRLGLRMVEVQPLGEGRCLITDSRIPRDWLLDRPCPHCFRKPVADDLLRRYPERFHPPAAP